MAEIISFNAEILKRAALPDSEIFKSECNIKFQGITLNIRHFLDDVLGTVINSLNCQYELYQFASENGVSIDIDSTIEEIHIKNICDSFKEVMNILLYSSISLEKLANLIEKNFDLSIIVKDGVIPDNTNIHQNQVSLLMKLKNLLPQLELADIAA